MANQAGLTVSEKQTLRMLEKQIDSGLKQFVRVGLALSQIRDEKLYRQTHERFEDYCRERWNFGSSRARQLIAAADTAQSVTPGNALQDEKAARAIRAVPEEQRKVVVKAASAKSGDKPLSAASIREAAKQVAEVPDVQPDQDDAQYPPCPNCGNRTRNDDGDCAKCKDPCEDAVVVDQPKPKVRGVGIQLAHEAIACLKRISKNDALRARAWEIVRDWLDHNEDTAE